MNRTGPPRWVFAWAAAVALLGSPLATAQTPGGFDLGSPGSPQGKSRRITFTARVDPVDPFSAPNRAQRPAEEKVEVRRGETFFLTIKGTFNGDYHTYPIAKRPGAPQQSDAQLSKMTVEGGGALVPLTPVLESEPVLKKDPTVGDYYAYYAPFTWAQEVLVKPDAPPGKTELTVQIELQVCDERSCYQETHPLKVPVVVSSAKAAPLTPELKKRLQEAEGPPPGGGSAGTGSSARQSTGLWGSILKAIFGGLISLLTPCVFPMIPITVSFFLKQSEARQHRALTLALVYSLTIVLVLAAGGLLLMRVLVDLSQHWATNFVLAAVFLFFALSLLGMYDITLPSWLSSATSAQEGRGGLVGTFFMALTFSIISFTCVGPIYGGFIAFEASGQSGGGGWLQLALSVLAFSAAFASPFFILALFPSLLRSLPRSGSWMNSVKVVMGFLELAAAFKFLRSAELFLTGKADWFTFDLVLGIWVALAIACGLYLLNVFRLPHDHDVPETIGVPRLLFSLIFLGLGLYMLPGLFKTAQGAPQKPGGELFFQIESFLLPESREGDWMTKLPDALARAAREKKLIFIDFTGVG